MFKKSYASVFAGDEHWKSIRVPDRQDLLVGRQVDLREESAVLRRHDAMKPSRRSPTSVSGARVLARARRFGHHRPHLAGRRHLEVEPGSEVPDVEHGVQPVDFNSYGARRGNHEVMMRGTFANIRLRNQLAPGTEGGVTVHVPTGEQMSIYDAAMRYKQESGTPLVMLAGKEYGTGSSRDWAAKGTMLLGVKAVISESFERIHRSNLIGMGVLPLQFKEGQNAQALVPDRQGDVRDHRAEWRRGESRHRRRDSCLGRADQVRSPRAHRYAERARVLPAWRHPALRAAAAGVLGEGSVTK